MKILKVIFISILVLIILVFVGVFIFLKTFDVNKYLPQITQQIGQTIKRQVSINHVDLDLSLTKGLLLNVDKLTIKDDARFSQSDFLVVDKAYVGLDLMALLHKEIHVISVVITSPHISIIRSKDGQINAQTMAPEPSSPSSQDTPSTASASNVTSSSHSASELPAISIKSVSVEHGDISFEDQNPQMPIHVVIKDITIKIDDFSLTEIFTFTINLDAWGKQPGNINITGRCALDLSKNAVHVSDLKINSDLSQWDWAQVKAITTVLEKLPVWPQEIKGSLSIDIPQLNASASGLDKLSVDVTLSDGYIKLKELLNPIKGISLKINSDLKDVTVKELKANIGTGEIDLSANSHNVLTTPTYDFKFETKGINIEEALDETSWPAVVKGGLTSQFSGSGSSFDPEVMQTNLKGDGSFSLSNGRIEKLNILQTVLGKLSFIPGLSNQIESALSSTIKDKLNTDTTVLDKAEGKIKVQDKIISIENVDVESKIFSIGAQGTVGFDLATDITLNMYIASDISAELTKKAKPLQGLFDDQKRMYIPGKISGKAPAVGYSPQIDYISKKVLSAEGTEQISKQLDKVFTKNPEVKGILNSILGGNKTQDTGNTADSQSSNTTTDQNQGEDSTKKTISNLLGNILR